MAHHRDREQQLSTHPAGVGVVMLAPAVDQPLEGFNYLFPATPPPYGEQGVLFTDPLSPMDKNLGYRGTVACKAAGISYRQLDYWARTKLVAPTVRSASGSGTQRLYSFRDVLVLKIVKRLLDTGVSLQQIRTSIEHLHTRGVEDLAGVTLMSDGTTVYECTSPDEVIDLVQAGQGVFGIAIGKVWREIERNLEGQPGEDTLNGNRPLRGRPAGHTTGNTAPHR